MKPHPYDPAAYSSLNAMNARGAARAAQIIDPNFDEKTQRIIAARLAREAKA